MRSSFFAGEEFTDLADAQRRAEQWCATTAGLRTHGTIQARPAEVFALEEQPLLLAAPTEAYDLPTYRHAQGGTATTTSRWTRPSTRCPATSSATTSTSGPTARLVRVFHRGQLVKVHVRVPVGGRRTDPDDLPSDKTTYALRDIDPLQRMAAGHGAAVGAYATALLDVPLPWTRMRQVYALLGLVKKWGPERVDAACARAWRPRR